MLPHNNFPHIAQHRICCPTCVRATLDLNTTRATLDLNTEINPPDNHQPLMHTAQMIQFHTYTETTQCFRSSLVYWKLLSVQAWNHLMLQSIERYASIFFLFTRNCIVAFGKIRKLVHHSQWDTPCSPTPILPTPVSPTLDQKSGVSPTCKKQLYVMFWNKWTINLNVQCNNNTSVCRYSLYISLYHNFLLYQNIL